jgi:hypothetical protein
MRPMPMQTKDHYTAGPMERSLLHRLRDRLRRRVGVCLLLALAFQAVAPAMSIARAAALGETIVYTEVCTAQGIQRVALGDGGASPAETASMKDNSCPLCTSHANCLALLSSRKSQPAPSCAAQLVPNLFFHAPDPLFAWAAHPPRAPPTFS